MTFVDRRVRARKADEEEWEDGFDTGNSTDEEDAGSEPEGPTEQPSEMLASESGDDNSSNTSRSSSPSLPHAILKDISFGELASAQSSLEGPRKRKRSSTSQVGSRKSRSPSPFHEASERQAGKKISHSSRSSKHAPTELSSKKAVSRKRSVVAVPVAAPRDPRFSALSGNVNQNRVEQNYKFLDDYRENEIADLKLRIKKEKNADIKEVLKREVRVMEDRERSRKRAKEEQEVVQEHKRKERDKVKEGKKPFFLKKGEVKKQVLVKRFEGMGEKRAEKAIERRRKKKAARERKSMPFSRRMNEDN